MSTLKRYKKLEKSAFFNVSAVISSGCRSFGTFLRTVLIGGRQKFTVMLIPHSEKKVFNFQISMFALVGFAVIAGLVLAGFIWYTAVISGTSSMLSNKTENLKSTQASLDTYRDTTGQLLKAAKNFEAALSTTLDNVSFDSVNSPDQPKRNSDLQAFFDIKETDQGMLKEVGDLKRVTNYLERAVVPVKELGSVLNSKSALLTEIPNIWPIKGGIGHISMTFGQNRNPFTGQWYIHTGVDFSTFRSGDPVIAAADGEVVMVTYDFGYGNNVTIKHKHGFYTRYAHLQSFRAYKGQKVQQGQVIGYIGNTGLSTGPHIHFEVHLGASLVDPIKFVMLRSKDNALLE